MSSGSPTRSTNPGSNAELRNDMDLSRALVRPAEPQVYLDRIEIGPPRVDQAVLNLTQVSLTPEVIYHLLHMRLVRGANLLRIHLHRLRRLEIDELRRIEHRQIQLVRVNDLQQQN